MTLDSFRKPTGRPGELWARIRRLAASVDRFDYAMACAAAPGARRSSVKACLLQMLEAGDLHRKGYLTATAMWSRTPFDEPVDWSEMSPARRRERFKTVASKLGQFTLSMMADALGADKNDPRIYATLSRMVTDGDLTASPAHRKPRIFTAMDYTEPLPVKATETDWTNDAIPVADRYAALRATINTITRDVGETQRFTERNSIDS